MERRHSLIRYSRDVSPLTAMRAATWLAALAATSSSALRRWPIRRHRDTGASCVDRECLDRPVDPVGRAACRRPLGAGAGGEGQLEETTRHATFPAGVESLHQAWLRGEPWWISDATTQRGDGGPPAPEPPAPSAEAAFEPPRALPSGLTLQAVSGRTGIPAATLRTWELRYGSIRPRRSPTGTGRMARTRSLASSRPNTLSGGESGSARRWRR
jgi:hypothetical protein